MRFMVIVKASRDTEAGVMPSEQMLNEMGKYNEELVKAGVDVGPALEGTSNGRGGNRHGVHSSLSMRDA